MKMYMIACLFKGNSRVGFRIFDLDTCKTIDVNNAQVAGVLKSGTKINNLQLDGKGNITGSNGDFKRYSRIYPDTGAFGSALVILNQLGEQGYTVCNYTGKVLRLSTSDVIKYGKQYGIANGKISSRDGTEFISAISGCYEIVDVPTSQVKQVPKQNTVEPEINNSANLSTPQTENLNKRDKQEKSDSLDSSDNLDIGLSEQQLFVLKKYYTTYNIDSADANVEIQELNTAAINNTMTKQCNKTKLLYEILGKLGGPYKIARIVGNELATIIVTFMQVELAFPKSLVFKIRDSFVNNIDTLCNELLSEFSDVTHNLFKKSEYSFDIAAQIYVKYMINHELLGEYRDSSDDSSVRTTIHNFALCDKYTLTEMRALIGSMDLLSQWESSIRSMFRYGMLRKYLDKLLRIAMKYTEDTTYNAIEQDEKDTVLFIVERIREFNAKDASEGGTYANAALKLWKIDDENMLANGCEYISTPLLVNDLTANDAIKPSISIIDVYKKLLYALEVGEEKFIYNFRTFSLKQADEAEKLQKKRDKQELDRIAKESLERQRARRDNAVNNTLSQRTEGTPKLQNTQSGGKTQLQMDIEANADLSRYDPVELYNWLNDNTSIDKSGVSFVISKDMLDRHLAYKDMSSRQRYRLNDAINTMLTALGYKAKQTDTKNKTNYTNKDTEENKVYQLSDRVDIKTNIDRLVSKSNSIEMQAILEKEPNVLKICYSVLRYGKASDKQIKHIDAAISLLDSQ